MKVAGTAARSKDSSLEDDRPANGQGGEKSFVTRDDKEIHWQETTAQAQLWFYEHGRLLMYPHDHVGGNALCFCLRAGRRRTRWVGVWLSVVLVWLFHRRCIHGRDDIAVSALTRLVIKADTLKVLRQQVASTIGFSSSPPKTAENS
jgi:hypothetical protein